VIEKNEGIDQYALEKMMGVTAQQIAEELVKKGVVKEVIGLGGVTSWYPYSVGI
jgi:predicted transcriptional regulator